MAWFGQNYQAARIAVVAPTYADARDTCVEGESGLLNVLPRESIRTWNRSLGELILTNDTRYKLFSADEPERLRGPQHHRAWVDELAAFKYPETWDQLLFGLRLGESPRIVATTTPKPTKLVKEIAEAKTTVLSTGSTFENAAHLAPAALAQLRAKYEGTRLGRQELEAEILGDTPGALWTRDILEKARPNGRTIPQMTRIVIGVDPSGSDGETGDSQGIVVAGLGTDGRGYILQDGSAKLSPEGWGARVAALYETHRADRVAAEKNFGGDMVRMVLQAAYPNLPVVLVNASRGKHIRAEPIAALYEQGRVTHKEPFVELEDQMVLMVSDGYTGPDSPDRLDAMVWAMTELMLEANGQGWIDYYRSLAENAEAALAPGDPGFQVMAHPEAAPEPEVVLKTKLLAPPNVSSLDLSNGHSYPVANDRSVIVALDDVDMLLRAGCARV